MLSKLAPNGIDIFFDDIGGELHQKIVNKHMKKDGKVIDLKSSCGQESDNGNALSEMNKLIQWV